MSSRLNSKVKEEFYKSPGYLGSWIIVALISAVTGVLAVSLFSSGIAALATWGNGGLVGPLGRVVSEVSGPHLGFQLNRHHTVYDVMSAEVDFNHSGEAETF